MIVKQDFFLLGQCYVHYNCALWSSGVELTSDDSITSVDRAVVAGASQRCANCTNFGATLPCRVRLMYFFVHQYLLHLFLDKYIVR